MTNGHFIVFDGPDGSGTTRQSTMLADRLREDGEIVLLTTEPTDSGIGKEIRTILHGETLPSADAMQLLFCADRAHHCATVIEPALKAGKTVICDRYSLSTIIYGSVQGVDVDWLKSINAIFPKPDLTFITLPSFEVCMERLHRREKLDQFEMENFQRRVYEEYKSLEDPSIIFVDTSVPKNVSGELVYKKAKENFQNQKNTTTQHA